MSDPSYAGTEATSDVRNLDNLTPDEIRELEDLTTLLKGNLDVIGAKKDSWISRGGYSDEELSFDVPGVGGVSYSGLEDSGLTTIDYAGSTGGLSAKEIKRRQRVALEGLGKRVEAHSSIIAQAEAKIANGEDLTSTEQRQYDKSIEAIEKVIENAEVLSAVASEEGLAAAPALERVLQEKQNAAASPPTTVSPASQIASVLAPVPVDPSVSTPEKAAAIRDTIQCWLSYNSPAFAQWRLKHMTLDTDNNIDLPGYRSSYLLGSGTGLSKQRISLVSPPTLGYGLQNKLGYRKGTKEFVDIRTHEYAQMSPMLRIFKVFRENSKSLKHTATLEFEFNNFTRLDGIAKTLTAGKPNGVNTYEVYTRGSEIGVKSFDWQFQGTDPFTATRDVSATLKLHAQSFAVLFEERLGTAILTNPVPVSPPITEQRKYKYIDLLVQPDCKQDYSPECFEVRVDVGYARMDGPTANVRDEVKDAIRSQKDSLYLTLVDHSFDIAEDGSVDITINFKGRIETLMKTRKSNVLLPYGGALEDALELEVEGESSVYTPADIEDEVTKIKNQPTITERDKERIKNFEAALTDLSFKYKQIIHAHILDRLYSKGLLFEYDINKSNKDKQNFNQFKRYQMKLSEGAKLPDIISQTQVDAQLSPVTTAPDPGDPSTDPDDDPAEQADLDLTSLTLEEQRKVQFFYFGDLVGIVLQSVVGEDTTAGTIVQDKTLFGFSGKPRFQDINKTATPINNCSKSI